MDTEKALKRVAKGAGIVFVGTVLSRGIAYLYRMLVARLLGPFDYGLLSLGIAVLSISATVSAAGLPQGVTRYVSFYRGRSDLSRVKGTIMEGYRISTMISIIVGVFLFLSSNWISIKIFSTPELANILKIFSFGIPFSVLSAQSIAVIRGFQKMKYKVYAEDILQKTTIFFFTLIAIFLGFGILGVTFAYATGFFISFIAALYYIQKKLFNFLRIEVKAVSTKKELLKFSLPLVFAAILWTILGRIDTIMLGYLLDPIQVGIYNAAFPTAILLMVVLSSTEMIFMPVASELFSQNKMKELANVFKVVTKWMFLVSFPMFLIMVIFSKLILRIMFGSQYTGGAMALSILAIGYFIASFVGPTGAVLLTLGKTKLILLNNLIVLGVDILLNWALIPIFGIIGAAIATAISISLWNILTLIEVYLFIKVQPYRLSFLKLAMASIFSVFIIYIIAKMIGVYSITLLVPLIAILIFLYFFLVLIFKGFEQEDIMILSTLEKKLGLNLKLIKKIIRKFL